MFQGTYLSIDMDFWDCVTWDWDLSDKEYKVAAKKLEIFRDKVFNKIIDKKIPCEWFSEHHHMVSSINKSDCEHIINLDFHSDLSGDGPSYELNEGNVFDHVIEPESKTFKWIYPYKELGKRKSMGRCDQSGPDVFKKKNWLYKKQNKTHVRSKIMDGVEFVGICLSPDWITLDTYRYIRENLLGKFPNTDLESIYNRHLPKG